jgi:hypothetical protein
MTRIEPNVHISVFREGDSGELAILMDWPRVVAAWAA